MICEPACCPTRLRTSSADMLERSNSCTVILLAWFPFGYFLPFIARFGFSYQQKVTTSNAMLKWKHPQKNQNEQQKAITSNKRHLPVLIFEIELILSQKQEKASKGSKRQRTANGNTHQRPKRATKSNKEHFSFPFSFIRTNSGPRSDKKQQRTSGLEKPKRARKNQDEQRKTQKVQM